MIQTFKQWDAAKRKDIAARYDVTLAELSRLYKPNHYYNEWWEETLKAYEAGHSFTTAQWNKLTEQQQYNVLRSRRALRMDSSEHYPWKVAA